MAVTSATEPMLVFLRLVLKDTSYITISTNGASYTAPVDPGASPVHRANATAAQFCHCTLIQLLKHLWNEYGTITFLQLREKQLFATEGSETIDNTQLLCLCYDNVNKIGLFNDA